MLKVDINKTQEGMRLALPVRHPEQPDHLLLRVGYELEQKTIDRMKDLGLRCLWIDYPNLSAVDRYVSDEILSQQGKVVTQIGQTFDDMQRGATAKIRYDHYCKAISNLVDSLLCNPRAAVFIGELADLGGNELMRHSSATTYLAVLMGLKLEGYMVKQRKHIDPARAKGVINLGVGAMMHDLGILHLDGKVRQRHEQTGDESDPAFREHPSLGYETLRGKVEPSAAIVVLHHHQRADGSGYAGKKWPVLSEERIHVFARVVGLAEWFDRMRFPRNAPPQPPVYVLSSLLLPQTTAKFDRSVMRALLSVVPAYPPGSIVKLNNNAHAVVIDHNPAAPCRPVIQPIKDPKDIDANNMPDSNPVDLSEISEKVYICECDGQDVAELNFKQPDWLMESSMLAVNA